MPKVNIHCPYCGSKALLRPSSVVYGDAALHPRNPMYVCARYPACNAYVAAHRKTRLPMGTLADSELRHRRLEAHHAITSLQKEWGISKQQIYSLLRAELKLPGELTHIAMCSEYRCDQIIDYCNRSRVERRFSNEASNPKADLGTAVAGH